MNKLKELACQAYDLLNQTRSIDFIAPLLLRLYLAPVFWFAGTNKLAEGSLAVDPSIITWFGNAEWGLGLPLPTVMAYLATYTEVFGAICLLFGIGVRWISVPLMFTMIVAAVTVHWDNGWQAVHDLKSPWANEYASDALDRLSKAKDILREQGNYSWLTGRGSFVVLNNGIEWSATYFVMLMSLFFTGAGRYVSLDYWFNKIAHK